MDKSIKETYGSYEKIIKDMIEKAPNIVNVSTDIFVINFLYTIGIHTLENMVHSKIKIESITRARRYIIKEIRDNPDHPAHKYLDLKIEQIKNEQSLEHKEYSKNRNKEQIQHVEPVTIKSNYKHQSFYIG